MKTAIFTACLLLIAATAFAYSSVEELMQDMNRQKLDALRAYVAANPDAEDLSEAQQYLMYGLFEGEHYDEALALLVGQYAEYDKSTNAVVENAIGELIMPIIQIHQMQGRKDEGRAFIERVRKDFEQHNNVAELNTMLDEYARMFDAPSEGDAVELAFTALDGRDVNLASMTGKVVLVDFWATWCMPCVAVMPEVLRLYEDFNGQGFEIIGVSLDEEKSDLEAFIAENKLPWPQHFDAKGWENEFAVKYAVQSIPLTWLIGPDGTIAAVNASDEELRTLIPELLAKRGE